MRGRSKEGGQQGAREGQELQRIFIFCRILWWGGGREWATDTKMANLEAIALPVNSDVLTTHEQVS